MKPRLVETYRNLPALGYKVVRIRFATILFGGAVLALALAFVLAGRDIAKETLERMPSRRPEDDNRKHL